MTPIIVPLTVTFGVTALAELASTGGVKATVVLGNVLYATAMLIAAEIRPDFAVLFAWVVVITVVLVNGQTLFTAIQKGLK